MESITFGLGAGTGLSLGIIATLILKILKLISLVTR